MSKLVNFYDLKEVQEMREASHNPHFKENDTDLPARVCIVGASGSGKTTSLLNFFIDQPEYGRLDYNSHEAKRALVRVSR